MYKLRISARKDSLLVFIMHDVSDCTWCWQNKELLSRIYCVERQKGRHRKLGRIMKLLFWVHYFWTCVQMREQGWTNWLGYSLTNLSYRFAYTRTYVYEKRTEVTKQMKVHGKDRTCWLSYHIWKWHITNFQYIFVEWMK